jgi:CRISPR type III-A/MTUBE-associated protein Csm6
MNNYVLFAPVSDTDPTRNGYDGPIMHIVRHYKPKKVYLFLTKRMCEKDAQNNYYEKSIKRFDSEIEIEKIERQDINDPSDFDCFFEIYPKYLTKIIDDNPGFKVLLNLTSGTPQMILALSAWGATRQDYIPIQVKTPAQDSNAEIPQYDKTKDESYIFENFDDLTNDNRTVESPLFKLKGVLLKEQLRALVEHYDYYGAYMLCENNKDYFDEQTISTVNHAYLRTKLKLPDAINADSDTHLSVNMPCDAIDAYEYYLVTRLKMLIGDLNSFVLNIKILAEKLALILFNKENIAINSFGYTGKNGIIHLNRNVADPQLLHKLDSMYQGRFNNDGEINLAARIKIIEFYRPNEVQIINELNEINKEINNRNRIAHTIRNISESDFSQPPADICTHFENLFGQIFHIDKFDVYELINDKIINSL